MLYPINTIIAIDQATGARVENGSGYVYAVSDTARAAPLSIFDLSGLPLTSNLLTTNSEALIPPFQVEGEWQVVFVSGDSEIILTSWLGLKEEAAASADAANTVVTRANNGEFKGEQGDSAYQVWLSLGNTGTVEDYRADIEGPPGKDGSNVLPTDEAIEQAVTTDGTATNAALKATFASKAEALTQAEGDGRFAPQIKNSVVLFGTSLEEQNKTGADVLDPDVLTSPALAGRGWFHWCNGFVGNQLSLIHNAGVGGNTYAQMLARIDADVLAHNPDWVFMGGPTNDTSTGRTAAEVIADAEAILDKLVGRQVLILTGPPNSGHGTAASLEALFTVNDWIRSLPANRPQVIVADAWRALSDGSTASPAPGLAIDGVHYSAVGAARVGKVAADAVAPWIASQPHRVTSAADPACIIANPSLDAGTSWATLGGGVTTAFVADDETLTTKAVMTYAGVTSTGNLGVQAVADDWAVGDVVQLTGRIRWENAVPLGVTSGFGPLVMLTFRSSAGVVENKWLFVASSQDEIPSSIPASGDVVGTTARYTIPATVNGSAITAVEVRLGFRGISDGTVTVSDVAAVRV